ncbi:MAG: hypothetical protein Q9208_002441 [Pyrenodesmia sp. 3 TL-2023]
MSAFISPEQIYDALEQRATDEEIIYYPRKISRWLDEQLAEASKTYTFMQGKTRLDYHMYHQANRYEKFKASNAEPVPTGTQLFNAAYDFDILGAKLPGPSRLEQILSSERVKPVPIGRLNGQTPFRLLPAIGALPTREPFPQPKFDFALTDSGAISYADGHPSEDAFFLSSRSTSSSIRQRVVTAASDSILRRFASLGWVQKQGADGRWRKTGHVLVIDMDDREIRHRHPWLVLASHWPTDNGEETSDGYFTIYAEEQVAFNDSSQPGVFPGNFNRTPICVIKPVDKSSSGEPVIKQLGEGFDFSLDRFGRERSTVDRNYGPGLSHVMSWYWDPESEEEVCYAQDNTEHMRYDPRTKVYRYPWLGGKGKAPQSVERGRLELW